MTKHEHSTKGHSPTYSVWHTMLQRCCNPKNSAYSEYGGAGITVCDRWRDFKNFLEDMGVRPTGLTLNRIKGAKIYSKETCEWVSCAVQAYDQKIRITNRSGKAGVSWNKVHNKWESYISVNKKKIGLGMYSDLDSAISARNAAELKYYGFNKV